MDMKTWLKALFSATLAANLIGCINGNAQSGTKQLPGTATTVPADDNADQGDNADPIAPQCTDSSQPVYYNLPGNSYGDAMTAQVVGIAGYPIDTWAPQWNMASSSVSYSISPSLPTGLTLNSTTGVISGTPATDQSGGTSFIVTVRYIDGQGLPAQTACKFLYAIHSPGAPGTFTAVGPTGVVRSAPIATLLQNGKVLVTGGSNQGEFLSSAELFDPAQGTFSATGPSARFGATIATVLQDGKVLLAGGSVGSNGVVPDLSLETYDSDSGIFSPTGASLASKPYAAVLLGNGKVLFLEGYDQCDGDGHLVAHMAEIYNPFNHSVSNASFNGGTVGTVLQDGRVLVRGFKGCVANAVFGGFETVFGAAARIYDPSNNSVIGTGRSFHYDNGSGPAPRPGIVLANGKVFFSDLGNGNFFQVYDPQSATFSTDTQIPAFDAGYPVLETDNGQILLASPATATFSFYDLSSFELELGRAPMIYNHGNGAVVALEDGKVLVTGKDAGPAEAEFYAF